MAGGDPFARLRDAPAEEPVALLHSCGLREPGGAGGRALWFGSPRDVLMIPAGDPAQWGDAFARIDAFLDRHADRPVVGYLGFDLKDAVESQPRCIEDDMPVPAAWLVAHDGVEVFDAPPSPVAATSGSARGLHRHLRRCEFEERVARVIEHIRAGDVFQVNLTQPFTARWDDDPRALFARLCAVSPAPFAAYCQLGDGTAVLSASPEEFLHRDAGSVRTRPIKGTRGRSADPARDAALRDELLHSEKDLAELAMIVDLMRNDLGRVAALGSVQVGPFPERRSFAQVHHLFATVTARLRAGVSTGELLAATFPGGSISGAPKLRCLEVVEDLEVVRRGVYTGAIGWFGPGPRMHLNVAIRTMTRAADGRVRLNVGGGITADSDPVAEYEETVTKAAGMLRALGLDVADLERAPLVAAGSAR